MPERARRRGFALFTVLWLTAAAGVIVLAAAASGRNDFDAAANRIALQRAWWLAAGCAARLDAAAADTLAISDSLNGALAATWRVLDRAVAPERAGDARCTAILEAAGTRLDVNDASTEELDRFFAGLDLADPAAMRDALLDWIDADGEPRPAGAEADWYRAAQRPLPRNDRLADPRELLRVRGFENLSWMLPYISTEDQPVCLTTAPPEVLAAIPGFTPGVVGQLLAWRDEGRQITDLRDLLVQPVPSDADSLAAHFPEIQRLVTTDPEVWIVTVRAAASPGQPIVTLEQRIQHLGPRIVVARTRMSP